MIHIQGLSFSFDDTRILKEVDVRIQEGEAWVVLGPSGHGKTTLLKLIAGLLSPTAGKIEFLREKRLSMLFQRNALFDSMTNAENITFPLEELHKNLKGSIQQHLAAVGLEGVEALFPDEISGGMQKRLGIARALAIEPEVLLYDDPTAGLDPITSREIAKLIRSEQKRTNATILSVSNDIKRVYQLGEKYIFVYDENVYVFDSKQELEGSKDPAVYQFIRGLTEGPLSANDY